MGTENRKAVLRSVRLDDDVWVAIKLLGESLNRYLRRNFRLQDRVQDSKTNLQDKSGGQDEGRSKD
jgi:hypothetical protein